MLTGRYGDRLDAWLAAALAGSTLYHSSATGQALVTTAIGPRGPVAFRRR